LSKFELRVFSYSYEKRHIANIIIVLIFEKHRLKDIVHHDKSAYFLRFSNIYSTQSIVNVYSLLSMLLESLFYDTFNGLKFKYNNVCAVNTCRDFVKKTSRTLMMKQLARGHEKPER